MIRNCFRASTLLTSLVFWTLLLAGMGLSSTGCGAARVTAYAAVDDACEQAEQEIEDRDRSTLAEDERDLSTVRDACDRILAAVRTSGGDDAER